MTKPRHILHGMKEFFFNNELVIILLGSAGGVCLLLGLVVGIDYLFGGETRARNQIIGYTSSKHAMNHESKELGDEEYFIETYDELEFDGNITQYRYILEKLDDEKYKVLKMSVNKEGGAGWKNVYTQGRIAIKKE